MKTQKWYKSGSGEYSGGQGLVIDEATGENIAVTYKVENAALISACPEMLAALDLITLYMVESHKEERDSNHHGDGPDGCSYCDAIKAARAALAKAEGK